MNRYAKATRDRIGLLLVAALGVGAPASEPPGSARATAAGSRDEAKLAEVLVTAAREDALLTAKVVQVLREDPYVYADHMSVVTDNGVVRLQGIAFDPSDLRRALYLARKVSGKRRIVNEVELLPLALDRD